MGAPIGQRGGAVVRTRTEKHELFGSVVGDRFNPETSDPDFLVGFDSAPPQNWLAATSPGQIRHKAKVCQGDTVEGIPGRGDPHHWKISWHDCPGESERRLGWRQSHLSADT